MECNKKVQIPRQNDYGIWEQVIVPCGNCPICIGKARQQWKFRLQDELQNSFSGYFITLTYDEDNVPYGENEPSLNKRDLQLFHKRLRKDITKHYKVLKMASKPPKMKYFCVGEYGEETSRPHYHGLYFNLPQETSQKIREIWENGHVMVTHVNPERLMYVTKYMLNQEEQYLTKERPFRVSSQNIGINYLEKNKLQMKQTLKPYVVQDGNKKPLPKYYKDKLYTKEEKEVMKQKIINEQINRNIKKFRKLAEAGENINAHKKAQHAQTERRIKKSSKPQPKTNKL